MGRVTEILDAVPGGEPSQTFEREERLLLSPAARPTPSLADAGAPLEAVHFGPDYVPLDAFRSPSCVYQQGPTLVEWQTMDSRQRFYHRNLDVDEMSYQVCGTRLLVSELGSVELQPGDFVRIPAGIAHDNWGREDVHVLIYAPGPAVEQLPPLRQSAPHVFADWEPTVVDEMVTGRLGGASQLLDERLMAEHAQRDPRRLAVVRPEAPGDGMTWLWKAPALWVGVVQRSASQGTTYRRHRQADEAQYQLDGRRTLVTQRGAIDLEPGDFVRIPSGCAFTSVHTGPSRHLSVVSAAALPRVAGVTKQAEPCSADTLERLRGAVPTA